MQPHPLDWRALVSSLPTTSSGSGKKSPSPPSRPSSSLEADLVSNGWMKRMLWWFWSTYFYFRWGRVKSKLQEVKRIILRSRSLSKMFQFKLFRYNIRAEWPTEVEIQFQLDWRDGIDMITVYELQLCLQNSFSYHNLAASSNQQLKTKPMSIERGSRHLCVSLLGLTLFHPPLIDHDSVEYKF